MNLKELSAICGVSVRTVNRVLKKQPGVRPEVAKRVLAAAKEHNYVPNMLARNLKNRSSRIVGVVSSKNIYEVWQKRLIILIEELARHRYSTLVSCCESENEIAETLSGWGGVADYVVFTVWNEEWDGKLLAGYPFKYIFLDCRGESSGCCRILTDRVSGAAGAIEHFYRLGKRRIAHVCAGSPERAAGVDLAMRGIGDPALEKIFIPAGGMMFDDGYAAGAEIERSGADAAFFDTDRMALGFYRYARERRIVIGRDIAVCGFDNDAAGASAVIPLSSIEHPLDRLSEAAVDIIRRRLDPPAELLKYPAKLIIRESSAG